MTAKWKGLIVIVLAVAVFAIVSGKRQAAKTTPAPSCCASGTGSCSIATAPAPKTAAKATTEENAKASVALAATSKPALPATSTPKKPAKGTTAKKPGAATPPVKGSAKQAAPPAKKPTTRPQLIELGSKTCTPCKMMAPILDELRTEYKGKLGVVFWEVYEHPDKAKSYQVRVIPTQVFIGADGKEFFRHEGFFPKKDILAKFREHGIALGGIE